MRQALLSSAPPVGGWGFGVAALHQLPAALLGRTIGVYRLFDPLHEAQEVNVLLLRLFQPVCEVCSGGGGRREGRSAQAWSAHLGGVGPGSGSEVGWGGYAYPRPPLFTREIMSRILRVSTPVLSSAEAQKRSICTCVNLLPASQPPTPYTPPPPFPPPSPARIRDGTLTHLKPSSSCSSFVRKMLGSRAAG